MPWMPRSACTKASSPGEPGEENGGDLKSDLNPASLTVLPSCRPRAEPCGRPAREVLPVRAPGLLLRGSNGQRSRGPGLQPDRDPEEPLGQTPAGAEEIGAPLQPPGNRRRRPCGRDEERYRALFESSPERHHRDGSGDELRHGEPARDGDLGARQLQDQASVRKAIEYIVPEDRARVMAAMKETDDHRPDANF